ncbi:hypothetical protein ACHAWU_007445 [Discostella pseudostelligera]|uniref:HpcH/HpaI aldolase/citrate lyase domain-containing protein n=1 Tax=Discostella pseudostelligera TaxID=259834 RepID=A0ABD3MSX4_9STRA
MIVPRSSSSASIASRLAMKYLMPSQLLAPFIKNSNRCYQSRCSIIRLFFHRVNINSDSSFVVSRQPQSLRTVVSTTTTVNINISALHNCRASTTTSTTTTKQYFNNDTISSIPLRSVLYVPASNTRALDKVTKLLSLATERAKRPDAIMYDLEDGVHPTKKEEARIQLYEYLQQQSSTAAAATTTTLSRNYFGLLRINRSDTPWFHDDASLALTMVLDTTINIHGVVLPKIEGWEDVDFVARHFRSLMTESAGKGADSTTATSTLSSVSDDDDESGSGDVVSPVPLWAMIETPRAILSAAEIARQASIQGLILGTNDLSKELRLRPTTTTTTTSSSSTTLSPTPRMGMLTSLQYTILAARAHDKIVIDGVYNNIASDADNLEHFRQECLQGKEWGMDGKTLIHPNQIQATNEIYAPSHEELEYARRVVKCWEDAIAEQSSSGRNFTGVAVLDGMMIEELHVIMARKLLEQAEKIHSM